MSTEPQSALTSAIYDALVTFNKTNHWPELRLAQVRQHLAEHIAAQVALNPTAVSSPLPDQTLRDRIASAVQDGPTWMLPRSLAEEVADAVLAVLPEFAEAHRLALSEALGLGTGAPWAVIHERATELGLPPLAEDPVAQRLGLVPPAADRAALLAEAIRRVEDPAERAKTATGLGLGWEAARDVLRRLAAEAQSAPCAECDHPKAVHGDGEDPVSPGRCTACEAGGADDFAWHNYQPAEAQQQPDTETPTVIHAVPLPGSNGISSCCGRPPCEFVGERLSRDPDEVTCPGPAVPVQPAAEAPWPHTMLGAAEAEEKPDLNITPLPAEALAADETVEQPAADGSGEEAGA